MASKAIPSNIQSEVEKAVEKYNKANRTKYMVSFRTKFCYLSRMDDRRQTMKALQMAAKMLGFPLGMSNREPEVETKIGRLEWTGDMDNWAFAVFRYSNEKYDDGEALFFMPGRELLDGTTGYKPEV